ncbi:hypothetical protein HK405_003596 [Cladochytrium tenue]|nr:hypothetical protein HK405_003596 [Cladochytrium tenue]
MSATETTPLMATPNDSHTTTARASHASEVGAGPHIAVDERSTSPPLRSDEMSGALSNFYLLDPQGRTELLAYLAQERERERQEREEKREQERKEREQEREQLALDRALDRELERERLALERLRIDKEVIGFMELFMQSRLVDFWSPFSTTWRSYSSDRQSQVGVFSQSLSSPPSPQLLPAPQQLNLESGESPKSSSTIETLIDDDGEQSSPTGLRKRVAKGFENDDGAVSH